MEGVELIKDRNGRITEIRVDVKDNPALAEDVYHLIGALKRAKETEKAITDKQSSATKTKKSRTPMSLHAFNQLIREAKASGEVTEKEFFQLHPKWRKKENLSLQS